MSDKIKSQAANPTRPKVVIERTYRAEVEELWELWTTQEGFESWWGPEGFRVKVNALEARLGGTLHYDMIADTPEMIEAMKQRGRPSSHEARGRFSEFWPQERLAITHVIDFLPGVNPYESTILVEFFPLGERVRMVITLDPMHNEEFTKMSTMGFSSQLTKLEKRFGGEKGSSARRSKMRELTADLFVSLDGFAAGKDVGPFFGYGGPALDAWVREELSKPQLVLMGRVTYEAMARISASATDEISLRMTDLAKVVFSNTLREPLVWKNSRLVKGPLGAEIAALKQQPGEPLRSIGSLSLVKSLMQLGHVDRLRLMVFPIVLGNDGQEPVFAGYPRTGLELAATRVLDSRLLLLEYRLSSVSQTERASSPKSAT